MRNAFRRFAIDHREVQCLPGTTTELATDIPFTVWQSLHAFILARSAGVAEFWNAFFRRGQPRILVMGMFLIPVRHRIKIIRTQVGVAVFDGHLNRLVETDRCLQMPAVVGEARTWFPLMKFRETGERMLTFVPDVTRMLDRLEARNLICRERGIQDRRGRKIRGIEDLHRVGMPA